MPIIYCSTKLATLIGTQRLAPIVQQNESGSLNAWNAQLFTIQRRKCILVANKATLYSIVRLDVLKKDLNDLSSFFIKSLSIQLKADGLYDDYDLSFWLGSNSEVSFCRTDNDRPVLGSITDLIYQLKVAVIYKVGGPGNPTGTWAGSYVNNLIMNYIDLDTPIKRLRKTKNIS